MAEPPTEVRVRGGGPAAALAAARLGRSRFPVRWERPREEADASIEGDLLPAALRTRLPSVDGEWDRPIVLHRWLLLDGARWTAAEFREPSGPELPVSVLRSEIARRCERAAREGGVTVSDPVDGDPEAPSPSAARVEADRAPAARPTSPAAEVVVSLRFDLPPERIAARFGVGGREGASFHWLGPVADGLAGGGTVRTYRDCLGVSLLLWGRERAPRPEEVAEGRQRALAHPALAPLLAGARLAGESVRHLPPIAAGGWGGAGLLRVGRALGLEASNGMEVRGLAAELASAEIAADLVTGTLQRSASLGDQSSAYAHRLTADPSVRGLRDWSARGARLRATVLRAPDWNRFAGQLFHRLMSEDGGPKRSVRDGVRAARRESRLRWPSLFRSAWNWWEGW